MLIPVVYLRVISMRLPPPGVLCTVIVSTKTVEWVSRSNGDTFTVSPSVSTSDSPASQPSQNTWRAT